MGNDKEMDNEYNIDDLESKLWAVCEFAYVLSRDYIGAFDRGDITNTKDMDLTEYLFELSEQTFLRSDALLDEVRKHQLVNRHKIK